MSEVACFIDGDFPTGKACKYHCSPTCHPCQVGPEWVYGCTCPVWPQNREHDFVPIVNCVGDPQKCEVKPKHIHPLRRGAYQRIMYAERKIKKAEADIAEFDAILAMVKAVPRG